MALRNRTEGKVYVEFTVDKNGNISGVQAINSIGDGCEQEAERVVKSFSRKIVPGEHRGQKIDSRFIVPINFLIQ